MKNKENKEINSGETMAILDQSKKAPKTNVSIPSPKSVVDAKTWVEEHEM